MRRIQGENIVPLDLFQAGWLVGEGTSERDAKVQLSPAGPTAFLAGETGSVQKPVPIFHPHILGGASEGVVAWRELRSVVVLGVVLSPDVEFHVAVLHGRRQVR